MAEQQLPWQRGHQAGTGMSHSSGCTAWRSPLWGDISCCGPHAYCLAGDSTSPAPSPVVLGRPGRGRQGSEGRTQTQALAQCSACSPNCTSSQSQGGKCHVELCQQTLPPSGGCLLLTTLMKQAPTVCQPPGPGLGDSG